MIRRPRSCRRQKCRRTCLCPLMLAASKPRKEFAARSHLPLDQHLLDLGDGLGGVEALRAGWGAIQDGVAAVEPERVFEIVEPLAGCLVAAVHDPTVRLQQDGRPEEALAVPPIAGTAGCAAEAEECSAPGPPAWRTVVQRRSQRLRVA